jgi:rod shape-determining protein MreC
MVSRNRKKIYAVSAVLLLAAAFLLPSVATRGSKGVVRGALAPAERGTAGLGLRLREAVSAVRGIGGAVERNRELSQELVRVQTELNKLRDAEAENVRLRRAFRFYHQQSQAMVPCDVIGRSISGWWDSIRIGKGRADGVGENRAVLSPDGLVGKTAEVSAHTSEVVLVSDPACRVPARIERVNAFGLVRGEGTDLKGRPVARMDFINKDAEVRVGDAVVTTGLSGEGGVFPKGVRIGDVLAVHRDVSGLYQYAEIAPCATVSLLETVFVVADAKESTP